jgi:hypothetical protein
MVSKTSRPGEFGAPLEMMVVSLGLLESDDIDHDDEDERAPGRVRSTRRLAPLTWRGHGQQDAMADILLRVLRRADNEGDVGERFVLVVERKTEVVAVVEPHGRLVRLQGRAGRGLAGSDGAGVGFVRSRCPSGSSARQSRSRPSARRTGPLASRSA